MTTLVISDSRGRKLQECLAEYTNIGDVKVLSFSGNGYVAAVDKSMCYIKNLKPPRIIIMLGICDITLRDKTTRMTELRSTSVQGSVQSLLLAVKETYTKIQALHVCCVSYATVTGLDLTDYNNVARRHMDEDQYNKYCLTIKTTHPHQVVLDKIILELNRRLTAFNVENQAPTTWIATAVHSYHNKKYHHYYKRLWDGCHPTQSTLNYWARQVVRVIKRMTNANHISVP